MALTGEQVAQYLTQGYFVLPSFFAEDALTSLRPSVPDPSTTTTTEHDPAFEKCVVFGCARTGEDPTKIIKLEGLGRLTNSDYNSQLKALFRTVGQCPRLAAIATQFLGVGASLMKDKYIFKGKGGGDGFPPHQDMNFIYSRLATDAVNFGVAFDAADASNGALEVCVERYGEMAGRLARAPLEVATPEASVGHLQFQHVCTAPGDVVVFSAWLLHKSTRNADFARDRNMYDVRPAGVPAGGAGSPWAPVRRLLRAARGLGRPQPPCGG